jgi:capsular polysaccharide biosynthesis protein
MSLPSPFPAADDPRDEIDLTLVLKAVRRRWPLVLGIALAATLIAALAVARAPALYDVQMEVAVAGPTDPSHDDPAVHDALRLTSAYSPHFMLYTELMHSQEVADALAKDPTVLKGLFPQDWDDVHGVWRPHPTLARQLSAGVRALLGRPSATSPGAEVRRFLDDRVQVDQDPRRYIFATVQLRSADPGFAIRFLNLLNTASNDRVRAIALTRAQQVLSGLEATPAAASNEVVQQMRQEESLRLAAIATPGFAAQVIEGPSARQESIAGPIRSIVTGLIAGLAAGLGLALILDWLDGRRRRWLAPDQTAPDPTAQDAAP